MVFSRVLCVCMCVYISSFVYEAFLSLSLSYLYIDLNM